MRRRIGLSIVATMLLTAGLVVASPGLAAPRPAPRPHVVQSTTQPTAIGVSDVSANADATTIDSRSDQTAPTPTDDGALARDEAEVARTLGVSADSLSTGLDLVPLVGALQEYLESTSPSFGGMYVDFAPAYKITVLSSPGESATVKDAIVSANIPQLLPFIEINETPFTESALLSAMKEVWSLNPALITSLDVDIRTGTLLVTVATPPDIDVLTSQISATDAPIPAASVTVEVGGTTDDVDSYGGLNLDSPNGGCTSGFSVTPTAGGADGVASAAHCPNNNVTENGITLNFVAQSWGGSQDAQWFHTPNMPDVNKIKDGGSSTRNITSRTSRSNMVVGNPVCHYGRTSGYGCGQIYSKNYNPTNQGFDDKTYDPTWIRVSCCSEPGDSGAPWFYGNSAYGINKGHTSDGNAIFMAQNYLDALGIRVKIAA